MRPLAPRTLRELHPRRPCGLPSTSACRHVFTDSSRPEHSAQRRRWAQLLKREPHRDFGQPAHWPQPDDAASRAMALDVRVALGGELLDGGVQRVHRTRSELLLSVIRMERSVSGSGDAIKLFKD